MPLSWRCFSAQAHNRSPQSKASALPTVLQSLNAEDNTQLKSSSVFRKKGALGGLTCIVATLEPKKERGGYKRCPNQEFDRLPTFTPSLNNEIHSTFASDGRYHGLDDLCMYIHQYTLKLYVCI